MDRRGSGSVAVAIAGALLALLHNGVGAYPFAGYFATDVAPKWPDLPGDVPPLFQYLFWSPLGPALGRLLGIGSRGPYLALHATALAAGLVAFAVIVQRRFGATATRAALVVVVVAPAMTVVLAWSGSYDTFTVVLALLLVVCPSSRWAAVLGVLLAGSALEHGVIVIALLGLLALSGVWGEVRPLLAAAGGLVAGGIVLIFWLRAEGIDHGSRLLAGPLRGALLPPDDRAGLAAAAHRRLRGAMAPGHHARGPRARPAGDWSSRSPLPFPRC